MNNKGVVVLTNSTESVDDIGLYLLEGSSELKAPKKKESPEVVDVPITTLDNYLGVYELAPQFKITITREKSKLFLQATNQPRFRIYPSSNNTFFLKVVEANVEFNSNEQGEIVELILNQNGQAIPGKKIE